jgi:flagellar basal-body rod protein FlgB
MMGVASYRHQLLTSNIANADTPGYRAKDISFQKELSKSMEGAGGNYDVYETIPSLTSRDANSVSLDTEMAKVAETHLLYSSAAQLLAMKFRMIKDVAKGGGQ